MGAVAFILALVSFTASIYLASTCGSIPTSRQELESFYLSTMDCGYSNLERVFSPNRILADCNGDSATISIERADYRTKLVALCILPDGTCFEENRADILFGQSSSVITLPTNSTDCLFGACNFGEDDNRLIFVNLSKCAYTTNKVTEYTRVTPTNASSAPQATTGAVDHTGSSNSTAQAPTGPVDPIDPTSSSDPQATRGPVDPIDPTSSSDPQATRGPVDPIDPTSSSDPHATRDAIISAMLVTITIVLLILALFVVAFRKRIRPKQVFSKDAEFVVTFQAVQIDESMKSKLHENVHLKLYKHIGLHTLATISHYQQNKFSAIIPAKVQNEPLAQKGVGNKATLSSVGNNYCRLGDSNPSEPKPLCRDPSGFVINGIEYVDKVDKAIEEVEKGYITNEQNTDILPPATLTGSKVDCVCEMLDEDSYGYDRSVFREVGGNQDISNSGNIPRYPCDNDLTEDVQEA